MVAPEATPGSSSSVWSSPERTAVLRARAEEYAEASREETEVLLGAADVGVGQQVLDVACGPGDPALAISVRVGPGGSVSAVDISEGALEIGRERAARAGLTNVSFRTADVASLPFPDGSFDRVTCRFGCMFFEDLPGALKEVHRVLRTGGKAAFMVWGPFEQPHFQSTVGAALERLGRASLPSDKSLPFRFAPPGSLEGPLADAGFRHIRSLNGSPTWVWRGTPESASEDWMSGSVYFRPCLEAIPSSARPALGKEIARRFRAYYDGSAVRVPLAVRVITAIR